MIIVTVTSVQTFTFTPDPIRPTGVTSGGFSLGGNAWRCLQGIYPVTAARTPESRGQRIV